MKKMKKHLLKKQQQLPCCQSAATTNDDGTKRKSKCTEELCKHRRHKKKRKHKKHDLEKGEEEGVDPQKSEAVGASEPAEDTTKQYHVVVVDSKQQSGQQQFSAVDNEDTEETMDSYSAADDPDFKDPVSGNNNLVFESILTCNSSFAISPLSAGQQEKGQSRAEQEQNRSVPARPAIVGVGGGELPPQLRQGQGEEAVLQDDPTGQGDD